MGFEAVILCTGIYWCHDHKIMSDGRLLKKRKKKVSGLVFGIWSKKDGRGGYLGGISRHLEHWPPHGLGCNDRNLPLLALRL